MRLRTELFRLLGALLLLALVLLAMGVFPWRRFGPVGPAAHWRLCAQAVEGDFLLLDGGERVRLVGVDSPEMDGRRPPERFAVEATAFTRQVALNRRVRLEIPGPLRQDRLGRTLAYVFLEDGTFLNAEVVRQGWGVAYRKYEHPRMKEFLALEREARLARRGLWAL